MKATLALAALAGLVSSVSGQYYGIIAARSASPIHLAPVAANGQRLWIGKKTASYCPDVVGDSCPRGRKTTFAGGDGTLGSGQQVYIDPASGAIGYTQAHSASMPEGAITTGWTLDEDSNPSFGTLDWKRGLLACSTKGDSSKGPWQIYANLKRIDFGPECLGFSALAANVTKASAWQYT
ncbi:hypothetical protein LTR37_001002 [Vermiconidia calcicola]|uniref:Uncharacterized protein n=1 Tax=Vermiconidia calcicola TaxID=1690605 RepID=A0ACC3NXU2_9PEZI|nr:hypothetical protein LTR37_001002 [Vermiconidia calcicola]